MPAVKDVGDPGAGEPHARFDGRELETERLVRVTEVGQPDGKPRASRLLDLPPKPRRRASSRPYTGFGQDGGSATSRSRVWPRICGCESGNRPAKSVPCRGSPAMRIDDGMGGREPRWSGVDPVQVSGGWWWCHRGVESPVRAGISSCVPGPVVRLGWRWRPRGAKRGPVRDHVVGRGPAVAAWGFPMRRQLLHSFRCCWVFGVVAAVAVSMTAGPAASAGTVPIHPASAVAAVAAAPSVAGAVMSVTPARVADSRVNQQITGAVPAMGTATVQVTGQGGVPAGNVAAVVLNVTVVSPQTAGYITVWPFGIEKTNTSNLNFQAGQNIPNTVIVPVGTGGKIQ